MGKLKETARIRDQPKPCRAYQTSTCTLGAACPKPHTTDPNFRKKGCRFFALSKCSRGNMCTYSHDPAMIAAYEAGEEVREARRQERKEVRKRKRLVGRTEGMKVGEGEGDTREGEGKGGAVGERLRHGTKDEQAEEQKDVEMVDDSRKE